MKKRAEREIATEEAKVHPLHGALLAYRAERRSTCVESVDATRAREDAA
jgi:hypothetical protein